VDGGVACECASRVADSHAADAQGGEINGSRADDNQRIMPSKSFLPKKPVIMQLSADPSEFSLRARLSGETLGVSAAKLIGEEFARTMNSTTAAGSHPPVPSTKEEAKTS
jgi:hypothetical protein